MSVSTYSGSCFCGQARFELTGEPVFACHCHCESCRRAAGAAFVTWVSFPRDGLIMKCGTISEYRSSPGVKRGHCSVCGTTLPYSWAKRPGEIDIALASIDDTTGIEPEAHIWVQDRVPWLVINDGLPRYKATVSAGDML